MPSATSPPIWLEDLETNGFAVVKGAVSEDRAAHYVSEMYSWLEKFPFGFKADDKSTWTAEHLPKSMKGGMYHKYSVAHEKFVWDARMEPGVVDVFAQVWGTTKLLVSFDGINMTLPQPLRTDKAPPRWPHVDQNPHVDRKCCVQGIINLAPNGTADGGLIVLSRSAPLFTEFFETHSKEKNPAWGTVPDDWHGFDDEEVKWFEERGAKVVKVNAQPGELLLWDSRTVHWNSLPQGEQFRCAIYACYTPASFATEKDLKIKKNLLTAWQRTTHWPHRNFWHEGDESEGGTIYARTEPFEKPHLSDTLLKLAGAKAY